MTQDDGEPTIELQNFISSLHAGVKPAMCYSTVTDLARLRGWSTSVPLSRAT